jgi:DNA-binding FadR family transcriptional regulator
MLCPVVQEGTALATTKLIDESADTTHLPRWPRRPQRLATAVVGDLVDRIVAGEYVEGTSLPIEPVLCDRFSVSRTTIREALRALEAMGLVEVRQGSGSTVRPRDQWNLLDPAVLAAQVAHDDELRILDEIIALRCQLEGAMAERAATRLDEEHYDRLAALLEDLESACEDPDRYLDLDVAFHELIMSASESPLSRAVISALNSQAFGSGPYIGRPTTADREKSNAGHRAILRALIDREPEAAATAMSEHIHQSWLRRRPKAPANTSANTSAHTPADTSADAPTSAPTNAPV